MFRCCVGCSKYLMLLFIAAASISQAPSTLSLVPGIGHVPGTQRQPSPPGAFGLVEETGLSS